MSSEKVRSEASSSVVAETEKPIRIEASVSQWSLDPKKEDLREFINITLPFGVAKRLCVPDHYNVNRGSGEQRALIQPHVRKLRNEMRAGNYTPTPVTAGLRARHRKDEIFVRKANRVELNIPYDKPLPLTDGQQRFGALNSLYEEATGSDNTDLAKRILELPIPIVIQLNGDTQRDFLNLQSGKPVDTSHMFSMMQQRGMFAGPHSDAFRAAFEVAKILHKNTESPFDKQVRFDTRSTAGYPVKSLCAAGSSDISTSLIGLARISLEEDFFGRTLTNDEQANLVVAAYQAMREKEPGLLEPTMPFEPPPEGKKGSATLFIGLATLLAYRVLAQKKDKPTAQDLTKLTNACKEWANNPIDGNFAGPFKRTLMGNIAKSFLGDLKGEKHEGLPMGLCAILSASAYGVNPLPKKVKTPAAPATEATEGSEATEAASEK